MKTFTKVLTIAAAISGLIVQFSPAIQTWISANPHASLGAIFAALVAAIVHNPNVS